ncbi:hypothetical protein B0H14DRAFT_3492829 [Mycena olivaceomarginata]|nr:hypothetical protein B0H14DRAFT_3492829 [Mycena olivaceomarginata]
MTCTSYLLQMRQSSVKSQRQGKHNILEQHEFLERVDGIERALVQFESTSNYTVLQLYHRSTAAERATDLRDSIYTENTEILSSTENEHVFLVYFFIFTMQEFAGELVSLVDVMRRIYSLDQARANRAHWWKWIFRCWLHREKPRSGTSTLLQPGNCKADGAEAAVLAIHDSRPPAHAPVVPENVPPSLLPSPPASASDSNSETGHVSLRSSRRGEFPGAWAVYRLWLRTEPGQDSAAAERGAGGERATWGCKCGDPSQMCGECWRGAGAAREAEWGASMHVGTHGLVLMFLHGIGLSTGKESGAFPAPLALGLVCESGKSECE